MKRIVRVNGELVEPAESDLLQVEPGVFSALLHGRVYEARVEGDSIAVNGSRMVIEVEDPRKLGSARRQSMASGPAILRSTIPGKVVRVLVETGQHVTAGQGLLVIEAMKMQNEIKSPRDGTASVKVVEHETVAAGSELVVIE